MDDRGSKIVSSIIYPQFLDSQCNYAKRFNSNDS